MSDELSIYDMDFLPECIPLFNHVMHFCRYFNLFDPPAPDPDSPIEWQHYPANEDEEDKRQQVSNKSKTAELSPIVDQL